MPVYLNMKSANARETVDELSPKDFPTVKAFRAELRRLIGEYQLCGMPVYSSSRMCSNWKD